MTGFLEMLMVVVFSQNMTYFGTTGGIISVMIFITNKACVDQRLSLMSTQAAPGANPILHGNFYLPN